MKHLDIERQNDQPLDDQPLEYWRDLYVNLEQHMMAEQRCDLPEHAHLAKRCLDLEAHLQRVMHFMVENGLL